LGQRFRKHSSWTYCDKVSLIVQVEPDKPGAEVSKGKKNQTPKNVPIGHRMCTRRPTNAMPKPKFLFAPAFGRSWWWRFGGGWLCGSGASVVVM